MMDWTLHDRIRFSVERYYQRNSEKGNINIPMYDMFVTELRKDWERAGYDLQSEDDLFKLWGALAITCSATAYGMKECKTREELAGALTVMATYANMTGLFLREMSKYVAEIPAVTTPEEGASE